MTVEVHAARLAARRRTDVDVTAPRMALAGRRKAAAGDDPAFRAAAVAAAHNPVLTDLFTQCVPVPRNGLVDLLALTGPRTDEPGHGDAAHAAGAAEILRAELTDPFGRTEE
ncbi:FCD domain-containing protein [Streptomyces sp. JW3]|uniref:FCD domain-containing protein n=1 Tax=Streptomyces sp. JW3 TaxID=3456955 RepID=UPI003FA4861A